MLSRLFLIIALTLLASTAQGKGIELSITEPMGVARAGWPVTSGVPLAPGELRRHAQAALFDEEGQELPLQTEVLSRWSDGSIRWLLLDFQVDLAADEAKQFVLRYGPEMQRASVPGSKLVEVNASPAFPIAPRFMTGPLRIDLSTDHLRLLDSLWLDQNGNGEFSDEERVTNDHATGFVLVAEDGTRYRADLSLATWTVEQRGPLRACVRIEGQHAAEDGSTLFPYVIRMHAFRGKKFFKFDYTFINDIQDKLMGKIQSIELVCSINGDDQQFVLNGEPTDEPARLYQVDDLHYEVNGQSSEGRAAGWLAAQTAGGGLALGVREFWQNWPKSLEVKPGELRLGLLPDFPEGQYDGRPLTEEVKYYYYLRDGVYTLKIGMARTHEVWGNAFAGEANTNELANFYRAIEKPLLAQCSPECVCGTGVLGDCPPADPDKHFGYDRWLDEMFDRHLEDQEGARENGLLNFGDWYDETKFGGGWGNQEYDTAHCFFKQYLRSGDRRYFDRARQGAGHMMDVDVLHAINRHIRGLDHHGQPQPGNVWTHCVGHTGGYYEKAPLEAAWWYQLGMLQNTGHIWIGGLSDCYMLTGNRRSLDVATLIADQIASGGLGQYTDHFRQMGWPLNLLMTAYEMTGEDKYLAAAEEQWKVLKKNLDPERGWVIMLAHGHCIMQSTAERCHGQNSYLLALTMSALARYHQATGDPEVLAGLSAGLDQMIRECWDEEDKAFHGTSCVHVKKQHLATSFATPLLSALAFAHEIRLTGNEEHRRIFREAFEMAIAVGKEGFAEGHIQAQAGYQSRQFHFSPHGLRMLEE